MAEGGERRENRIEIAHPMPTH